VNKDAPEKPLIIWLGTNTCAGDMLSFLNAKDPGYEELISSIAELHFDYLLSASEGSDAINVLGDLQKNDKAAYILVVEGSIPTRSNGLYSVIGYRNGKATSFRNSETAPLGLCAGCIGFNS
jgi:hydrogenase small subunit